MTDLISRQDAIALLTERKAQCPSDSVQRAVLLSAINDIANMPSADTLATNEINALKDALAQAEGEIADLQRSLEGWQDAAREDGY